jgi:hypothetical protein
MGNLTYRGGPSAAMMAARGERGALIVDQDFLTRLPSSFPLDTPVDMSDILLHF